VTYRADAMLYEKVKRVCVVCRKKFDSWHADTVPMSRCEACCPSCEDAERCPYCGPDRGAE
jgi:hypothetical protein